MKTGIDFFDALLLLLIGLKATGHISDSWGFIIGCWFVGTILIGTLDRIIAGMIRGHTRE